METTIYEVTCYAAYQMYEEQKGFALEPWGVDTEYYQGYDDGGVQYNLPADYVIGFDVIGNKHIYRNGHVVDLVSEHGRPAIVLDNGDAQILEAVR